MSRDNPAPLSPQKLGVLLVNLGTPNSPQTPDVRTYLREFLSDPRVVDINPVGRWLLLNMIILPFRPAKSAHAYQKIWTDRGSPLLFHGQDLAAGVQETLGEGFKVELAMRYGHPSIPEALQRLVDADIEQIIFVPLFPQYSSAATGSAIEKVYDVASGMWNVPSISTVPAYYAHPDFIESFAAVTRPHLDSFKPDYVMFSYHGVPERQVQKSDTTGAHCLVKQGCCDAITPDNRYCYRAQCYATTRALSAALSLQDNQHEVAFQSRLGRTPWIRPYTDVRLVELAKEGKKRLAVLCPAFVADCLETIEEIGMRAKEDWVQAGGEDLILVPSLNAHPRWVQAVSSMVTEAAQKHTVAKEAMGV